MTLSYPESTRSLLNFQASLAAFPPRFRSPSHRSGWWWQFSALQPRINCLGSSSSEDLQPLVPGGICLNFYHSTQEQLMVHFLVTCRGNLPLSRCYRYWANSRDIAWYLQARSWSGRDRSALPSPPGLFCSTARWPFMCATGFTPPQSSLCRSAENEWTDCEISAAKKGRRKLQQSNPLCSYCETHLWLELCFSPKTRLRSSYFIIMRRGNKIRRLKMLLFVGVGIFASLRSRKSVFSMPNSETRRFYLYYKRNELRSGDEFYL